MGRTVEELDVGYTNRLNFGPFHESLRCAFHTPPRVLQASSCFTIRARASYVCAVFTLHCSGLG